MKLNLLFFSAVFAIVTTVSGEFLRGNNLDQKEVLVSTVTTQDQDTLPIAVIDIDETHLKFFDLGDALFMLGTAPQLDPLSITSLNDLSPVKLFKKVTHKGAPSVLVNAQKRIEKLMGTPSAANDCPACPTALQLDQCKKFPIQTEDGFIEKHTEKMGGVVEPIRGCVALKVESWNGSDWQHIRKEVAQACVGSLAIAKAYGASQTYSFDVDEVAAGDKYILEACWE
jgi:hypothetical protein